MKGIKDVIVKGSIFAVLSAVFCMGGIPAVPLVSTAHAEGEITGGTTVWSGEMTLTGSNVTIESEVTLNGNTTLTVAESKTLTINDSINCDDHTLTVAGPGTVTVNGGDGKDGIKGNVTITGGTLIVFGGTVYQLNGCGIKGNVKLTGGTLKATGGAAAGDQISFEGINGDVEQTGGMLIVSGGTGGRKGGDGIMGDVELNGGTLKATGGTGDSNGGDGIMGDVELNGGTMKATGGTGDRNGGKGIVGAVELNGGTLTAIGGEGLKSGGSGIYGNVTLTDGTLKATGGTGETQGIAINRVVTITDGKSFTTDGIQYFNGPLELQTIDEKAAIAGKLLTSHPIVIDETCFDDIQAAMDAADPGDTIKLLRDVEIDSELTVNKNLTLDLNGHTIDLNKNDKNNPVIFVDTTGDLTLSDNSIARTGLITGGLLGNNSGGGVFVRGGFTMNGGTISGNTTGCNGGGVYIDGGIFTMNGGTICNNVAGVDGRGGGVYVLNGSFTISGGIIKDNRTGVGLENVFLPNGKTITISGELDETTSIGITPYPIPGDPISVTSGWNTYMKWKDPTQYFITDNPYLAPALNSDGEIAIGLANLVYQATVENGKGSCRYFKGTTVTIRANDPPAGEVFDKWTGDGVEFANAESETTTFTMPANAVTVTATYKDKEQKEEDNPDPQNPNPGKPGSDKTKVPVTDPSSSYASADDNFAPVAPGASEGTGGNIKKLELDFSNVKGSGVAPDGLKMTAIAGSKFTTKAKVKDKNSVQTDDGIKAKFNKKDGTVTITCKNTGKATFDMEDGDSYTVAFTVEKPKPNKSEGKLTAGSAPVTKTVKDLFGTSITGGKLEVLKEKVGGQVTPSGNGITINPAEKNTIKIQYQYLNKKYKMSIKIK